jgi:hypothetical protein
MCSSVFKNQSHPSCDAAPPNNLHSHSTTNRHDFHHHLPSSQALRVPRIGHDTFVRGSTSSCTRIALTTTLPIASHRTARRRSRRSASRSATRLGSASRLRNSSRRSRACRRSTGGASSRRASALTNGDISAAGREISFGGDDLVVVGA